MTVPIFEHAWAHFTYTSSDGQNGGPPPISDGLDALFRRKSLRWSPGRPSRAAKPSIPVDTHVRVSRPPKKMLSITYFLTLFEPARVPPRPLVHPWILIAVREQWDGLIRDRFAATCALTIGKISTGGSTGVQDPRTEIVRGFPGNRAQIIT